jgi:hypothetical protein
LGPSTPLVTNFHCGKRKTARQLNSRKKSQNGIEIKFKEKV